MCDGSMVLVLGWNVYIVAEDQAVWKKTNKMMNHRRLIILSMYRYFVLASISQEVYSFLCRLGLLVFVSYIAVIKYHIDLKKRYYFRFLILINKFHYV